MTVLVILLSERKSKNEKEITEILKKYGANHYTDKTIFEGKNGFTCINIYKPTELLVKNALAVFIEKTTKFNKQKFPISIIGVCEDSNKNALENFKKWGNAVITCGINNKNTLTISSFSENSVLVTLQRSVIDLMGNRIEPCEFKIRLSKQYNPYSVLSSVAILILLGINPTEFWLNYKQLGKNIPEVE